MKELSVFVSFYRKRKGYIKMMQIFTALKSLENFNAFFYLKKWI